MEKGSTIQTYDGILLITSAFKRKEILTHATMDEAEGIPGHKRTHAMKSLG